MSRPMVVILVAGKLGGELAIRFRQPAVLDEIIAGLALGNLGLGGVARARDYIFGPPECRAPHTDSTTTSSPSTA
jgi:hypothetical protein